MTCSTICEWCADYIGGDIYETNKNPISLELGEEKVIRQLPPLNAHRKALESLQNSILYRR